jgi:alpha-amylase
MHACMFVCMCLCVFPIVFSFLDNHDNARFLNQQKDYTLYENALTYTVLSTGIPIIYYGTEQGFAGGGDPNCREVLWTSKYDTAHPLYQFLTQVITVRKQWRVWQYTQIEVQATDRVYAFVRGQVLVVVTNAGGNQQFQIHNLPFGEGSKVLTRARL